MLSWVKSDEKGDEPIRDCHDWVRLLETRGELQRVDAPVSPVLEITEIADRVMKRGGKALLFTHVEGSRYPVLIGAMGSEKRMSLALEAESLDGIAADVASYLALVQELSPRRLFAALPKLPRLAACLPVRDPLPNPPCQQVVEREPDLRTLPVLHCWPQDGGRFFTLPIVFTGYPGSGAQNAGMYRMQVLSSRATAMHWHKHKDGSSIYEAYRKRGARMPVAVALGCHPAVTYAATAPLPPGIDEMLLAGFLRRRPVRMTRCRTVPLWVPREAEFVLEGYVDPAEELVLEGPFGDHTGYYSLADYYPRFHVTAITHRRDAIYPATVVGRPPMEDCFLAKATERIFLPLLRAMVPQLVELNLPLEGVFHNCAIVSVRADFPGAARTVMNALWGMGQMRYTKLIVAVDGCVDPRDTGAVLEAVLRIAPETELVLSDGPLDALDHASPRALYGTRLGIDATAPLGAPGALRVVPVTKTAPGDGLRAAEAALGEGVKLAVAVDAHVSPDDRSEVFWRLFNNIDARRDLTVRGGSIAVDATKKLPQEGLTRPWPDDIVMSADIRERVTRRWDEYGIGE